VDSLGRRRLWPALSVRGRRRRCPRRSPVQLL